MKNLRTLERIAGINGVGMVCEARRIDLGRIYDYVKNPKYIYGLTMQRVKTLDPDPNDKPLGFSGTYTFVLDYPLGGDYEFEHKLSPKMTALDICRLAAGDYSIVYRSPAKYGVWGHSISDLAFESIDINDTKHRITFGMGS